MYYLQDESGRQESLKTTSKEEAKKILHAREQATAHPLLNRELAKTYLKAADPSLVVRTWEAVMTELSSRGGESTRARYERAMKEKTFDLIRRRTLTETTTEDFLKILKAGTSTTNHYLRRLHNLALGLGWLLMPVLSPKQWQPVKWRQKRAIKIGRAHV